MTNYNGLTRNQWPGTWSPSANHPIVLDAELRGALRYVEGADSDKISLITGQRLQDGMIVYVGNDYTDDSASYSGGKYYKYSILSGQSRNASTGELPNNAANWSILPFDSAEINTIVTNTVDASYIQARQSTPNSFSTINIDNTTDLAADTSNDTFKIVAGSGISLSANAATDTVTITSTGGGGGGGGGNLDFGTIASPAGFTLDLGAI